MHHCETIQSISLRGCFEFPFSIRQTGLADSYRPGDIVLIVVGNSQNMNMVNIKPITRTKFTPASHCPVCGAPGPSCKKWLIFRNNSYPRSASQKFEIDPEELHEIVWEIPVTEIATLYGVSTKVIEKRCRAFGISQPPRDHWATLEGYPDPCAEDFE